MHKTPRSIKHIDAFLEEWMRAEEVIKLAERIREEAVIPAINELRYGARRLVQALRILRGLEQPPTGEDPIKALDHHFIEAIENCIKAQHDALDAAIMYAGLQAKTLIEGIGLLPVLEHFPQMRELISEIHAADLLIVDSRRDRQNLNKRYEELKQNHLEKIVDLSRDALFSVTVIDAAAKRKRAEQAQQRKLERRRTITWGVISSLIASIIFTVIFVSVEDDVRDVLKTLRSKLPSFRTQPIPPSPLTNPPVAPQKRAPDG